MVKIIIASDNDILYKRLSNIFLQNKLDIQITEVPNCKLEKVICKIAPQDTLIILNTTTLITFCTNIVRNTIEQVDTQKSNIIILVTDSNSKYQNNHLFSKNENNSILEIVNVVSNSFKNCVNLEKSVNDILWQLGFTDYFKGTIYLKEAILLAYNDKQLLLETKSLVKKVAEKNNIEKSNVVRSNMDRALNSMLNFIDKDTIYSVFGKDYDGRTISLKYFICLCIRYLENKDIAV